MQRTLLGVVVALCLATASASTLYDLTVIDIHGNAAPLSQYKGNVSLVVNVATYCGTTEMNYKGMVALQNKYVGKPFVILAFPCNQFANQEPKSNSVIEQFARSQNYTMPLFAKSNVNGPCEEKDPSACKPESTVCCPSNNPVYAYIESVISGKVVWNFDKYLVDKTGVPKDRWIATKDPASLTSYIDKLLAE